ncbi:MAG TPA: MlaD family protein [Gemmatales bacterium]|nr:MlaD family protein [Gemmatales bacterium]HMP59204.1 MlaD family protein [Gemmatales bacterium]
MTHPMARGQAIRLGVLVLAALFLAAVALFAVGDRQRLWHSQVLITVRMPTAGGVEAGTRVRVQGVNAGQVERLELPANGGADVLLRLRIDSEFVRLLHADAIAEVQTEGLLGGKVVEILRGQPSAGPLGPDRIIAGRADSLMQDLRRLAGRSQEVIDEVHGVAQQTRRLTNQSEQLIDDLTMLTKTTSAALAAAQGLLQDLREGQGPMGREVMGTLQQLQITSLALTQSLEGLRNLPLLGKYWDTPSSLAAVRLLVRPNFHRSAVTFREEELFAPGQALFLPGGLKKLDAWATQELPRLPAKGSEIVIVAYQNAAVDPRVADVLSQRQAEAVRTYLIDHHKIDRLGWITSRSVQALGMGVRPAPGEPPLSAPPAARIELIVFMPPGG